MFCKKCGQEIKVGVKYCPKCGNEVGSGLPQIQRGSQAGSSYQPVQSVRFDLNGQFQQNSQPKQDSNKGNENNKRILFLCIGITVIVLAAVLIALFVRGRDKEPEEEDVEVSLVGEWKSDDIVNLEAYMRNILIEEGVPSIAAGYVIELMGMDSWSELTLTFTNSGSILVGMDGVSLSVGTFTYEELSEGRLLLNYQLNASVLGTSIPISIVRTGDYTLNGNSLEMEFFDCWISFTRVN